MSNSPLNRRDFVARATLAAAAIPVFPRLGAESFLRNAAPPVTPGAKPFDLHRVRLLPGIQRTALEVNRRYMLGLAPDRLLHNFRINAAMPSSAEPLGGWEAPDNELRGHFVGHYLSACALMAAQTGDEEVRARGALIVSELARCQTALGAGYLSAFPKEFFERLKRRERVWAPFYTYHKILAGLLDSYTLSGNKQALDMARGMAQWVRMYAEPIPDFQWQSMLTTEYGGMNDVLRELSQVTGERLWSDVAARFDHDRIFAPLAIGRDELKDVHANTNVPKVLGAARAYEMTGDDRMRAIVDFFWEDVTGARSYATGGTSNGEAWRGEPGQLARALGSHTQETCVTYNMLKLTRHKFEWSPEARYADFYERAYFNGILGTQHPADGEKVYYTPLATGYWKLFGTPDYGFWCCHGSGVENFSKLGDSVYFHDDDGVYVNLFVASEVNWQEKGVRLRQETRFPETDTTLLTVTADRPTRLALRVRVPYWASKGGSTKLNGRALDAFAGPSSYLVVDRVWKSGDTLEVTLPMSLHTHPMPDDHTIQAVMYGPLVLVGKLGTDGITDANRRAERTAPRTVPNYTDPAPPTAPSITPKSDDVSSWLAPVAGKTLEFRTVGQAKDITFVPLYTVFDERYGAYWKINRPALG
ncbi:MAG TPA: beta-L-arabinofuranosidase domain-containing protein [Gemmatimonadaceae bacterium]|nr:beta-L-arabinofuranosidase domain-containing protein [Gemmatimonadaceae bacterium]